MNDRELDDMLNQWADPAVPPTLRENVRAGFRERLSRAVTALPRPRFPRLRFAFAFAGMAAFKSSISKVRCSFHVLCKIE